MYTSLTFNLGAKYEFIYLSAFDECIRPPTPPGMKVMY